jgi:hypothetical protein
MTGQDKFEGLPEYVVVFWGRAINGLADEVDGTVFKFNITPEDARDHPDLKPGQRLFITESADGFIIHEVLQARRTN